MSLILACLLLSIMPRDDALRDYVDLVEVAALYDDNGRLVFTQEIFWDWTPTSVNSGRYSVVDWRLIKSDSQIPVRDFVNDCYRVSWLDGEHYRVVLAKHYRETWEQIDVEVLEREIMPKEKRRGLRQPRPRVQSRP